MLFRRLTIRGKLILALFVAALLSFAVASAAFMFFERFTLENRAKLVMTPYAQLVSVGVEAAVAFVDPDRAEEILATLQANPQIIEARIDLAGGRTLARYSTRPNTSLPPHPTMLDGVYVDSAQNCAVLAQGLKDGARLYLLMNLDELNRQTRNSLLIFASGVIVLLATVALGLLTALQRTIVRPISTLVETVEQVRGRADYSRRVPTFGVDEVARLGQSFNDMLAAIQEREDDLHRLTLFQRTILDNAAYGIVSTDPDGIITSYNPAAQRLLGYASDEVIGKQTPGLWHDQEEITRHALDLSKELDVAIAPGIEVFTVRPRRNQLEEKEWTFICKNGMRVPVYLSVTPLQEKSGQITGFVGLFHDLTERKRAEEDLRRHKEQLEETVQHRTAELRLARDAAEAANKAKSVFLANMSHELRTPLNAILGFSHLMRKNPLLPENERRNIDIINLSGEHLLTLINDVLEMAKIEAGSVQLDEAPFDLGGMVRDVTEMMQLRATEKHLKLFIDQSADFPRYIVGDEARLRQVLINLLGNAVKFTQQGSVTIRLGTKNNTITHLLIEVEDSGPGIAPEDLQRIFEPFVQLGQLADNKGTGLGLSITRQFVQLMKGRINLESTLGKGSLFRVDLPLRQAEETDVSDLHSAKEKEIWGLAPDQPEYRILIIEDQLENQLLLAKLMESVGFQFKLADNGKQGVEIFQSWHPHLIWMDRRMPVMDGLEATKMIRALPGGKAVKIIAVTASAFTEQRTEMLDAGMDGFIRKPYRAHDIYECLSRQLGVQYIYSDRPTTTLENQELTPAMLSVLPEDLFRDLEEAVKSLDSERIGRIIEQIAPYDQKLRNVLARLSDNFDYPAILKALRTY